MSKYGIDKTFCIHPINWLGHFFSQPISKTQKLIRQEKNSDKIRSIRNKFLLISLGRLIIKTMIIALILFVKFNNDC